ncbi:MAG: ABC transporter ATP-binding protein [Methylocystis sp.]|nr:ABC transporter ATP-binding protein [Methylocystis sp.]
MPGSASVTTGGDSASPIVFIREIIKRYGANTVLDRCSLAAHEGEILTLLGPSGCGKTTLLRCIAGFIQPDGGAISIDGADMAQMPVNRRPVGVVFQSYALFPHLTVAGNVGYGLRMRGVAKSDIAQRVKAALASVSLSGLDDRYPAQLSGGQQQRVAIARVVVLQPRVLLLDEPFNALDAKLRGSMQVELRHLIKQLGLTALFVTHDQEEAMTLSDRIAVMRAGRIEQLDRPDAIYDRPTTAYVAYFIGASNTWYSRVDGGLVRLPDGQTVSTTHSGDVKVMVRPHNLVLHRASSERAGSWSGKLVFRRHVGAMMEYEVQLPDGQAIRAVGLHGDQPVEPSPSESVTLAVRNPAACMVFPAA